MDNIENIKKEYSKRINIFSTNFEELNDYQIEKIVEFSMCTNLLINFDEVLSWWNEKQTKFSTSNIILFVFPDCILLPDTSKYIFKFLIYGPILFCKVKLRRMAFTKTNKIEKQIPLF